MTRPETPKACPTCGAVPPPNRRPKTPTALVRAFLDARCVPDGTARTSSADLFAALLDYCEANEAPPCTQRALGLGLGTLPQVQHVRLPGGRRAWVGIRLLPLVTTPTP